MMTPSAMCFILYWGFVWEPLVLPVHTLSHVRFANWHFSDEQPGALRVVFVTGRWGASVWSVAAVLPWHSPFVMTHFAALIALMHCFSEVAWDLEQLHTRDESINIQQQWNFEMRYTLGNCGNYMNANIFVQCNLVFRAVCSSDPGSCVGWGLRGEGKTL